MKYFHKKDSKHWIESYGFEECSTTVVGLPCQYEKCLSTASKLFCVWVGVDFRTQQVHIYFEYDCGGEVTRGTVDVGHVDIEDEYAFMTELETIIEKYMGM
jgi:hypothetical protein